MSKIKASFKFHGQDLTADVVNPGDWFGKTWLICIEGGFTPLFLIVESDSASDAISELADSDEFGHHIVVDETDLGDYDPEILADEDDSDLVLNRKLAACDVLAHKGPQAKPALAVLNELLPLVESECDSKRWLALRAARAVWKITGDSSLATVVAEKLAEDEEAWLRVNAADLLGEIPAGGG